jgi:hypothetical protein
MLKALTRGTYDCNVLTGRRLLSPEWRSVPQFGVACKCFTGVHLAILRTWLTLALSHCAYKSEGPQICRKSRRRLKVVGPRRVMWSKFHTEDPRTFGATVQNLVARYLCTPVQVCYYKYTRISSADCFVFLHLAGCWSRPPEKCFN